MMKIIIFETLDILKLKKNGFFKKCISSIKSKTFFPKKYLLTICISYFVSQCSNIIFVLMLNF